jgi:hypothetical protein
MNDGGGWLVVVTGKRTGMKRPAPFVPVGQYLADFQERGGRLGSSVFTRDPAGAMRFATEGAAYAVLAMGYAGGDALAWYECDVRQTPDDHLGGDHDGSENR